MCKDNNCGILHRARSKSRGTHVSLEVLLKQRLLFRRKTVTSLRSIPCLSTCVRKTALKGWPATISMRLVNAVSEIDIKKIERTATIFVRCNDNFCEILHSKSCVWCKGCPIAYPQSRNHRCQACLGKVRRADYDPVNVCDKNSQKSHGDLAARTTKRFS